MHARLGPRRPVSAGMRLAPCLLTVARPLRHHTGARNRPVGIIPIMTGRHNPGRPLPLSCPAGSSHLAHHDSARACTPSSSPRRARAVPGSRGCRSSARAGLIGTNHAAFTDGAGQAQETVPAATRTSTAARARATIACSTTAAPRARRSCGTERRSVCGSERAGCDCSQATRSCSARRACG